MSPVCQSCGYAIRPQSRFCPRCGTPVSARLAPGTQLKGGDYVVVRPLTKGGMGAIYLAQDRCAFDRPCVLKQMLDYYNPADPAERSEAQQRFEFEGRTLASLSHPGIPKIYAFFSENGRFYLVMEYIQGENLESFVTHEDDTGQLILPARRLPQEEMVDYTIQACRILEYLHGQPRPVVHGDIKPANLVLEVQLGDIRMVDFGTVSVQDMTQPSSGDGQPSGERNSLYGTDGYAPPEQYRGVLAPRSDVFSLASTAYHVLTDDDPSRHPFKWPMLQALPRELALALERALRNNPERRSTAAELRQALETLATPKRTLQSFTFPGGTQIRSVGALPALCDEHWDAARSFLYHGDFQRWLRDINRHDLVVAADAVVAQEKQNRDAGLEVFLRQVDPGLPKPKAVSDPTVLELGSIAREAAISRRLTLLNVTRGYTLATLSVSQPWLEIYPATVHLWVGRPVDVRVSVLAEGLPFRRKQHGIISIQAEGVSSEVPISAQVSLWRESWRVVSRALSAALPEGGRTFLAGLRMARQVTRTVVRPLRKRPWIFWLLWFILSTALGLAIYSTYQSLPWPTWMEGLRTLIRARLPETIEIEGLVLLAVFAPPGFFLGLWLLFSIAAPLLGLVFGLLRGAFRSFFR